MLSDSEKWPALLRGQIVTATINKNMIVVRLMDQKAQIMILLNSILIPMCINALAGPHWIPASICIVTAVLSIFFAIICIYPKRKHHTKDDRNLNLLHFNDISRMEEDEFKSLMLPVLTDLNKLMEIAVHDIYDMSRYSLKPKIEWLKAAYKTFCFGNLIAIIFVFFDEFILDIISKVF